MKYIRKDEKIIIRLDIGEEILTSLKEVAKKENVKYASVSGLGASSLFTVGVFSVSEKKYYSKSYKGDYEIVSLLGNVEMINDEPYIHLHASFATLDNNVIGGHLNEAFISVTSEITLDIVDVKVNRVKDENIGINLLDF